ncbi:hypothetical protein LIA77_02044 [Sarocladium implicatum]|nr:hypothetical protein LIA77_02044 [Sarocladium implicatum]
MPDTYKTFRPGTSKRERGVLAQRAYRKRHASKFQTLKEENERLREAIHHIGVIAKGEGRFTGDLDAAISIAASVARTGGEDANSDSATAAAETVASTKPDLMKNGSTQAASDTSKRLTGPPVVESGSTSWSNEPGWRNIPTSMGFLVDGRASIRSFSITSNCVSYLGDTKPGTWAGAIYRAVLSVAIRRWNEHFQHVEPPSDHPLPSGFMPGLHHPPSASSSNHILDLAFPLLHPTESSTFAPSSATSPTSPQCIFSRPPSELPSENSPTCAHDVVQRCRIGEPEGWWRAADGVELFLRKHCLPPEGVARLDAVLAGGGSEKHQHDVKSVLEKLALNYKCFGDGPRWNAVYVTVGMEMFRQDIMDECVG